MRWTHRYFTILALFSLALGSFAPAALAVTAGEVASDVAADGFYLDPGVSISSSDASQIVATARNNGSRFHLVVLDTTPPGGNTTFAEAVLDDLGFTEGTVLVLSADDVGWVTQGDGFTKDDMAAAFDFANNKGGSDADYAANFVVGLIGEPTTVPPTTVVAPPPTSGQTSGGSSPVWIIAILVVIGLLVFWVTRRSKRGNLAAVTKRMAEARAVVQKQVDAVANDILDMEDEVRGADNPEVDEIFNQAGETYRSATDELPTVDTPAGLLDISNRLDTAIWQLDVVEAILDDKPRPTRPEPKRLASPSAPPPGPTPSIPAPSYSRRSTRRSSYLGPGMMDLLVGVAGQVLAGGGGRPRSRMGSITRRAPVRTPRRRRRSGGGMTPGPRSRSPRGSSSSGGSRRIRGGGKRRK